MKTMTCTQLGGACDITFQADTWDDMVAASQAHGKEMMESADADHLSAMDNMRELMKDPAAMKAWMDEKHQEFDATPED